MKSERYERGMKAIEKVMGPPGLRILEGLKEAQPDFHNLMVEFGFGEIHSRPGLDLKQRQLITISSLITQGDNASLTLHINAALNVGLTPTEIVETVIHCIGYTGFPKALGAMMVVMKVFEERNVDSP